MNTLELKGLTFRVSVESDDGSMGAPWDEHDGHGPVRNVRGYADSVSKKAGERVLHSDRGTVWLYDWAEAMKIAKQDGWGLSHDALRTLINKLGRAPTLRQIHEAAVQRDFDHCAGYARGDWYWIGVVVTLLDVDGNPTRERDSVWGIESDSVEYIDETARELAGEIAKGIGRRKYVKTRATRVKVRS